MTGYSATVQARPDTPAGLTDDQIDRTADLLAEHHGTFSADPAGGWGATFSVDAVDAHTATGLALEIARTLADQAQLPAGDVVRLEAVRDDVLDEELAIPNYPDLVSGPEAAVILGVSRQRVHQLATMNSRFPAPLYRLAVGSLWVRAGIERFADEWDRRPGRRVASTAAMSTVRKASSSRAPSVAAKASKASAAKMSRARKSSAATRKTATGRMT